MELVSLIELRDATGCRVSVNAQNGCFFVHKIGPKTSRFVGIIAINNEDTSKILGGCEYIYVLLLDSTDWIDE